VSEVLNAQILNEPIRKIQNELRKHKILEAFPDFAQESEFNDWYLSLYKFATIRPLRYFRKEAVSAALQFFNRYPQATVEGLVRHHQGLTHALMSLIRSSSSWGKEDQLLFDSPADLLEFETIWHPEYVRYCEHIFNHLIKIPLSVLEVLKTKPGAKRKDYTVGLPFPDRIGKLIAEGNNGLATLTQGYNSIVRNAISHGSITFGHLETVYRDDSGEIALTAVEYARLIDDIVDSCHSIVIALLLFVSQNRDEIIAGGLTSLPLGLRFLLFEPQASHRDFKLVLAIESKIRGGLKQLNLHCRTNVKTQSAQLTNAIAVSWYAAAYGNDYERFSVSIDCGTKVPSLFIFNGNALQLAINKNWTIRQCREANLVEHELVWSAVSKRNILERMKPWVTIGKVLWEQKFNYDLVQVFKSNGRKMLGSRYSIRHVRNNSSSKHRRIEAFIVLHLTTAFEDVDIDSVLKHMVKRLRRHRIKKSGLDGDYGRLQKPQYIFLRIYLHDKRLRSFSGWNDNNQIIMAEWYSPRNNIGPIFVKQADMSIGRIRVQLHPKKAKVSEDGSTIWFEL
jgi:hypothetical protein